VLLFTRNTGYPTPAPRITFRVPRGYSSVPGREHYEVVALSIEVGGGQEFQFTRDGARF
jgi:hypothetical protein